MRIDIIFSDLDGTLLLGDKGLSPGTAEALARAAERGISFVPATGRFFNAIPRAVQELPFWRYAIVMNGAVVWDRAEGRAIRRAELSPELAVRVMARLEDFPGTLDCYMEDNCGWMEARYYAALDDWILDPVSRRIIREMRRPMEDLRGAVGGGRCRRSRATFGTRPPSGRCSPPWQRSFPNSRWPAPCPATWSSPTGTPQRGRP